MLVVFFLCGVILLLVCVIFAGLAGAVFVLLIALGTPKEKRGESPRPTIPYPTTDEDLARYKILSMEMMVYANRQDVVYHQELESFGGGNLFMRTTTDRFGKRRYVERQRSLGKTLQCTLCRYDNGTQTPSTSAMIEVSTSRVEWGVHYEIINDIYQNGSKISFWDERGRYRQARVPKKRVEKRV